MRAIEKKIPGVLIVETNIIGDHRGYFTETYNKPKYAALGITSEFVQDTIAPLMRADTSVGMTSVLSFINSMD